MATPLHTTIKRQIHLHGIDAPVNVLFHPTGIEMTVAGAKTKIFGSWEHVADKLLTPDTVPSIFEGKALTFLKYLATKLKKG
jgi:hypothetical protein